MNNTDVGSVAAAGNFTECILSAGRRVQRQSKVAGQGKETALCALMHHFTLYLSCYLKVLANTEKQGDNQEDIANI